MKEQAKQEVKKLVERFRYNLDVYKKLNELAESEGCRVNELISRLIRNYRKGIK